MKSILKSLGVAILGGAVVLGSYKILLEEPAPSQIEIAGESSLLATPVSYNGIANSAAIDFTEAAEKTIHAVIKNL